MPSIPSIFLRPHEAGNLRTLHRKSKLRHRRILKLCLFRDQVFLKYMDPKAVGRQSLRSLAFRLDLTIMAPTQAELKSTPEGSHSPLLVASLSFESVYGKVLIRVMILIT